MHIVRDAMTDQVLDQMEKLASAGHCRLLRVRLKHGAVHHAREDSPCEETRHCDSPTPTGKNVDDAESRRDSAGLRFRYGDNTLALRPPRPGSRYRSRCLRCYIPLPHYFLPLRI